MLDIKTQMKMMTKVFAFPLPCKELKVQMLQKQFQTQNQRNNILQFTSRYISQSVVKTNIFIKYNIDFIKLIQNINYKNTMNEMQIINKPFNLIINADDLGYNSERDRAIFQLVSQGLCSSVSVIINGKNIKSAVKTIRQLKSNHNISIGLHFNITEGIPTSCGLSQLIKNGEFLGKNNFYQQLGQNMNINKQQVSVEFRRQIQQFIQVVGLRPSHIDGHNHVHVIEDIAKVLAPVMIEYGVYKTRIPLEKLTKNHPFNHIFVQNAKKSKQIYQKYGIIYPQNFIGLEMVENFSAQTIIHKVQQILKQQHQQNQFLQVMSHPGYPDLNSECSFANSHNRLNEKKQLESQIFLQMVKRINGLSCFQDLGAKKITKIKILIYSKMTQGSGNLTTSLRIKKILQQLGYAVYLRSVESKITSYQEIKSLKKFLYNFRINLIIGVNITRTSIIIFKSTLQKGQILYRVPYILILAGTDVNIQIKKQNSSQNYAKCLQNSQCLISLSQQMTKQMRNFCQFNSIKIDIITISQSTQQRSIIKDQEYQQLLKLYNLQKDIKYIIFPTSFRKVKGVGHILKELNEIKIKYNVHTIIVGPIIDKSYYETMKDSLKQVIYLGVVDREKYYLLLSRSFMLINTSQSEGMSCSILQAFAAKIPVIARYNSGNANLIKNGKNGFLYEKPEQFITIFQQIYEISSLSKKITNQAYEDYLAYYSYNQQKKSYRDVLQKYYLDFIEQIQDLNIFNFPQIHPTSKINLLLFEQIPIQKPLVQFRKILDLGCGSGVMSLMYLRSNQFYNIQLTFSDISEQILSTALYNWRNNTKKIIKVKFIKSLMFSAFSEQKQKQLQFDIIFANLPQTPFQLSTSKPDKNGGVDGFRLNKQLLNQFQFYSKKLIILYSFMSCPTQFRRILSQKNIVIEFSTSCLNHRIQVDAYEKMEKGLSLYLKKHIEQGKAQISLIENAFAVPAQILILKHNDYENNNAI